MSSLGTDPAGIGGGRPHAQNKDIPPHLPTTPLSLRPGFLGTELGVSLHSQPFQPPVSAGDQR